MEALVEILEQELEGAFEVKDKKSLHRYVLIMTENVVRKDSYEQQYLAVQNEIRELAGIVKLGFERMDERFEAVDRKFEAMDKKFEAMDKKFEVMDKKFEAMDRKFEARFEAIYSRMLHFMIWSFGFTISLAGIVVGIIKFL